MVFPQKKLFMWITTEKSEQKTDVYPQSYAHLTPLIHI